MLENDECRVRELERQSECPREFRFMHYHALPRTSRQSLCACAVAYVYLRFVKRQSLTPVTMKRKADRSALMWQYAKVALLSSIASPFGYGRA